VYILSILTLFSSSITNYNETDPNETDPNETDPILCGFNLIMIN